MTQTEGSASNFDGDPNSQDIFNIVNREVTHPELQPFLNQQVIPALKLYAYNFFSEPEHATITKEIREEFQQTCIRVNAKEQEYAAAFILGIGTTTGGEIEWLFHPHQEDTLKRLGFRVETAVDEDPDNPLRELELPWTHSGATQSFAVEQLYSMGAFTNPDNPDAAKQTIGLHLNFAIPRGLETYLQENLLLIDVIDALTASYVSFKRLQQRKSKATFTTSKETDASLAVSEKGENKEMTFRLELRPLEVGQDTYQRLFTDAQHMVIGLFQSVRALHPEISSTASTVTKIAEIFNGFSNIMWPLRLKYKLPFNFALMQEGHRISTRTLLTNPDLKSEIEELITTNSNEIASLVIGSSDNTL